MRFTKILMLACIALFSLQTLAQTEKITNELVWYSREFSPDYVSGIRSMNDGKHYTSLKRVDGKMAVVKYAYKSGDEVGTVVSSEDIFTQGDRQIENYTFSKDEKQMLIATEVESIYRHSTKANYFVHNLEDGTTRPLADSEKGKQRLAEFSPDGTKVAFVRGNNLFVYELDTKQELQITIDGEMNKIINGATDWVYEEEFAIDKGFYWSPESDRIAFYKFDEGHVKEFQMALYNGLYPEQYKFKYPKAGERNSIVLIYIHDLNAETTKLVDSGEKTDIYYPRIKWTESNDGLAIMRMNRHQNHLEFLVTDLSKEQPFALSTSKFYDETSETYIEINDNLIFLEDGNGFLWNSMMDGYNHIYHFGMDGKVKKQLTKGEWDVIAFEGFDHDDETVYYTSAEVSPMEKHLYSADLKGKKKKLSEESGYNSATFSNTYDYYINYHTSASTPYHITLHNSKGKEIRVLEDNSALKGRLKKYDLSEKEFFSFENREVTSLNCWMIKPPNFDETKEYPVYVSIYGGPGSNTVKDSWGGSNYFYHQLLAQEGYIVVSCDPRGTMYRGREFNHSTYLQLGKLETQDFIDFAKYLGGQDYIDSERIGMQGWSYGGYMTSLAMTKGADYFKMGIAVAPVTNWRYYDTIYTERFMRTPQENADGYDDNSPINHVEKLEGAYLLVHGSADDNVHYQNSMEMINALVEANKEFDFFVYPNKNHGIYGGKTRWHLFNKMLEFTKANL